MKKYIIIYNLFLIVGIFFLYGCMQSTQNQIIFETTETELNLYVGDVYTPKYIVENLENYHLEYLYDTNIINIENDSIYCLEQGECEIIVSLKDYSNVDPITLKIKIEPTVPNKIICEEEITVFVNETCQLNILTEPEIADKRVKCISYDSNIATGNEFGCITGINEGTTYILIKSSSNPNVSTRVLVHVKKPPVEIIETSSNIVLGYFDTYQLDWSVLPIDSCQEVLFSSDSPEIASVDQKGLITAHKYGTCNIKIQSVENENIFVLINVKVDGDKTTNIVINKDTYTLQIGDIIDLDYTIIPTTAFPQLDIFIDDESGIEVSNNKIIAKKAGMYKIILKTIDDTNIVREISVKVIGEEEPIFITDLKFEEQNSLSWNEEFDPLSNIRAFDNKDGDITDKITVIGDVDNRRYGEYTLKYIVEDSDGNQQTYIRNVVVSWGYDVTVIGHAGSYYGVPNSEEAILYAAEVLKYPAIEIDLKQTKDGIFVLSHDPNWADAILEQTNYKDLMNVEYTVTKKAGYVDTKLTEEQRTYTATICTFERYLEICKQYNIIAVIELKTSTGISNWTEKHAPHQSRMSKIMEIIEKYDMLDRVIFLSSQELCLNWVKTNGYSYIPCQYLTLSSCENETTYNIVKQYNLDISFNVRDGIKISDEWLEKYRALGCKLAVFTFEEYATYSDIQEWIDRGVDFVTTDWHQLDKLNLPKSN